jgi:hypothetical protein
VRYRVALIFEARLEKGPPVVGRHVGVYLAIPKKFLSEPFNLAVFKYYTVEGEILDIKKI